MANYKSAFLAYLDHEGIKYSDRGENRVMISYRGDNTKDIDIQVIFDEDGEGLVALRCWSFGKVPDNKFASVLMGCNELNNDYRWVKFTIDKDNDVAVSCDAVIDIDTVGAECLQLVRRMVNIYDDSYPVLMKKLWGDN